TDGTQPAPDELAAIGARIEAVQTRIREAGAWVFAGGLAAPSTATVLRPEGEEVLVVDGPFAEGKEVVGGYGIVEAASREEAVEGAVWLMNMHREHWPGWEGEVEVRQIMGPEDFAG
ncbi:MAG TPA: YciI family protein, partial [Longimicrobium sp.]